MNTNLTLRHISSQEVILSLDLVLAEIHQQILRLHSQEQSLTLVFDAQLLPFW